MNRIPTEFTVTIPNDMTAQYPASERDQSKLLVYDRSSAKVIHVGKFQDVTEFIAGDLIVVNDTKVVPARLGGHRPGGGKVDCLFINETEAMITPSRRLRPGMTLTLPEGASFTLSGRHPDGHWLGEWRWDDPSSVFPPEAGILSLRAYLEQVGRAPLPPYIRRSPEPTDRQRYQTVYAKHLGSLAAPTAGLHFTKELMKGLEDRHSRIVRLTLDVGLGTFQPIRTDDLLKHRMHTERYHIPSETSDVVNQAKLSGKSITVVGTTVVRALEAASQGGLPMQSGEGYADLFIYPPYRFKVVDRLLTNFHRPDSTLLQLMAALIGWDGVNLTYQTAMDNGFHFYSYGDAMLVI
ncbi:MAG: tRNA preQ1(34) S-adenosylmethionine ribosyltransferase-isomerase QueA [Candidatus Electryoneaceae bacterium]|nr:tRNA preQ1(34) S-adenosylmethionine ribosyltransferase-isomerase QueA [Candidatus Electryoneaceae bacterium]